MIQLSVKDFLSHLAPCFSCRSPANVFWVSNNKPISTYVKQDRLIVEIATYYRNNYYLTINLSSSQLHTNDSQFLSQPACLQVQCDQCHSYSQSCKINYQQQYVLPITIAKQYLVFASPNYHVRSLKKENFTQVYNPGEALPILQLPFIPSSKFKTKTQMIHKLEKYLLLK